jgi:hypothetical protein
MRKCVRVLRVGGEKGSASKCEGMRAVSVCGCVRGTSFVFRFRVQGSGFRV